MTRASDVLNLFLVMVLPQLITTSTSTEIEFINQLQIGIYQVRLYTWILNCQRSQAVDAITATALAIEDEHYDHDRDDDDDDDNDDDDDDE